MNKIINIFKNVDKWLFIVPLCLGIISVTMMLSTSYTTHINISGTVINQTAAFVLGFIAIFVIMQIDYSIFEDWQKQLYIISVGLLLLPFVPGLGKEVNGARSWIDLRVTTLQPSEFVKITFCLLMAGYLIKNKDQLYSFKGFFKALLFAAPIIGIVLIEDFGSAAVFAMMWLAMVLFAGLSMEVFTKVLIGGICLFPIAYNMLASYQQSRITAFLYPDDLTNEATRQVFFSKIAIGSGGLFGKGLFHGTQNTLNFLPIKNSDFIFAVIVEEFGLMGGLVLIGLFILLIRALLKSAWETKDNFGSLVIIGFTGMFLFQIFENIGMCMGLMPVTGITLPFISYGGSSVLTNLIAVGFAINIVKANRGVAFLPE